MRKTIFITTLLLVSTVPTTAHAHDTTDNSHSKYHGVLPDAYYDGLGTCETGNPGTNKPNWKHSTRSYTGGLGIARSTFRRWSDYPSAKGLTPRQQVKVADAIAFKSHIEPDGTKVWRVGPWGWGCLKLRKSLQRFICESRHPLVQKWKRGC